MPVLVCAFRLYACVRDEVVHNVVTDCGCARGVLHILAWIGVGTRVRMVARTRTWTAHWRQHSQYTINISVSFLRAHVMQHVFEGTGKCKIKARGVDVHAMWCSSPRPRHSMLHISHAHVVLNAAGANIESWGTGW